MSPLLRIVRWSLIVAAYLCIAIIAFYVFGGRDTGVQKAFVRTFGDVMEWKSRWIAGWDAVNCGTVPVRGNADAATACALRAFAAHQPFRVRYGLQTMDTDMAAGVVAAPNGRVYEIVFSGGPTGTTDAIRQRAVVNACPVPASLRRTANGRVTCFGAGPSTPENWTSSWLSAP